MPEPFHLLLSEPETGDPSMVMKVVKQRFARQVRVDPGKHQFSVLGSQFSEKQN
jgi:hypothetical protein